MNIHNFTAEEIAQVEADARVRYALGTQDRAARDAFTATLLRVGATPAQIRETLDEMRIECAELWNARFQYQGRPSRRLRRAT